ncbi:MAG TPA: glycosyltransferase, partial [Blastocatellia bacterium]|nr:glycosyltransferase [Blastocatellia bacterium]
LVSVIMPFFNAERFFRESIESVIAQTYPNWELLLVDDGSADGSTEIALEYARKHPEKVRYLEHERHQNKGASASRNLGIRHARGSYIAFLDADDVYLPEKLARQVPILESHPEVAMVYGATYYWHSWTGSPEDVKRDWIWNNFGVEPDTLVKPPRLLKVLLGEYLTIPCTCSLLARREAVERVGGFEESFKFIYTDQAFYAKFFLRESVITSNLCLDKYRQHPGSCCSMVKTARQTDSARAAYLNWLEKYLSAQKVEDMELWKTLEQAMWPHRHPVLRHLTDQAKGAAGKLKGGLKSVARRALPVSARRWLRARLSGPEYCPPAGWVDFGHLRRVKPFSRVWGFDRGQPVDRYYIEGFLAAHAGDIQGRVLEIADNHYTRRFGGDRVTRSDVLHPVEGNPQATIVADLASGAGIPSDAFDCVICTQTLLVIYDVRAVIRTLHRILKPGGVLLVTIPGVSHQISRRDMERWGDYWRFTSLSARRLFEESFPSENVTVETKGNVLAAAAFLYGLAAEELSQEELDYNDPDYEVSIAVRAVKPR